MLDWFTPPTAAWWFVPVSVALLSTLLVAAICACWLIIMPNPLTQKERRAATGRGWLRWLPILGVGGTALVWFGASALLCLAPRSPRVVVLGPETGTWQATVPTRESRRAPIDARLIVNRVLAKAIAEPHNAAKWFDPTPERRDSLRDLCLKELTNAPPWLSSSKAPAYLQLGDQAPRWVRVSVEQTVVLGLLARTNVSHLSLCVDPDDVESWSRLRRSHPSTHTSWSIESDDAQPIRVRQIFDGQLKASGQVRAQALVEGKAGASGNLDIVVMGDTGAILKSFAVPVTLSGNREVIPIAHVGAIPGAYFWIGAERGNVRTRLLAENAPPAVVPVLGNGAVDLVRTWDRIAGSNQLDLAGSLSSRGVRPITLTAGAISWAEAVVEILPNAIVVKPPLLNLTTLLPNILHTRPVTLSDTGGVASFAAHVSSIDDMHSSADPLMSVGLRRLSPSTVPLTAPGMRSLASGTLMNQPLDEGRFLSSTLPASHYPVLETGRLNGKQFVIFRISADEQGLLWPSAGSTSPGFEPARARAVLLGLAAAVERLHSVGVDSDRAPRSPEPAPLLTAADRNLLSDLARRPMDIAALLALSLSLAQLAWQAHTWSRGDYR